MVRSGTYSSEDLRETATLSVGTRLLIGLFVFSLLIPSSWEILGLRLTTARVYALCLVIPLAIGLLAQRASRVLLFDVLIVLHALWIIVSMVVNHGFSEFAISGMLAVELLCGYLVGRVLIPSVIAFKKLFSLLFIVMLVLLPFALYEMATERAILQEMFRGLLGSAHGDVYHPPRLGFYRAQTLMQHPILWGVFCAVAIANVVAIWSIGKFGGILRFGVVGLATLSSMSSGAVLAALIQIFLMAWGHITRGAWTSLSLGFAIIWIFLTLASNRGPLVLMVTYLTFSPETGWGRIHIWNYGIDDAIANPIFGIGLHEWTRPFWLESSVDNFWLLMMMRHGFVGFGLLALAIALHVAKVMTAKGLSPYELRLRQGYIIGLIGMLFALATVHFWGPPYLLFFCYLGAGVWFYDRHIDMIQYEEQDKRVDSPRRRAIPYARAREGQVEDAKLRTHASTKPLESADPYRGADAENEKHNRRDSTKKSRQRVGLRRPNFDDNKKTRF